MYSYNFLKYRVPSALFSLVIIVAGVAGYVLKGGFRFSVDFTGGTEVRIRFDKPEKTADIKALVHDEWNGTVYNVLGADEIIVRVQDSIDKVKELEQKVLETVNKADESNKGSVIQINSISNSVGESLWAKLLRAIIISLALLMLYITFSFQFAFAMGAVVAIAHDALVILSWFVLLEKEISIEVIGAILATLGYSINDTIIIFSKIRQNLKKEKGKKLYDVVNLSLNQTLRRTILTSFATALVVLSQFVFGGPTIRDLSFALLLGIVFGTFSSIYIASPVMMLFTKKNK
ncbi:MAG: protein translocase subunit SecF [Epsilonproteobacteria bacterium]|nr:protein translocase subunit SecF [Campylobacterota bacterium]|tara:strand:- start:3181 stop:4050 length:870 start_codon:yes stop_codon:yes gene_type:complete